MTERFDCRDCGEELETYIVYGRTFRRRKATNCFPCQNPECPRFGMQMTFGQAVPRA